MARLRARAVRIAAVAVLAPVALVPLVRAQNPSSTGFSVVEGLGLPAVDVGALVGEPHRVNTPLTRRAPAVSTTVAATARIGPSGAAYAPGRVLVKFRGGASATLTTQSLRTVSASAALSTRPQYSDFDIVTIDPAEDALPMAAAL